MSDCLETLLNRLDCNVNPETQKARESLIGFMEFEGRGLWQKEPHLELLCSKLEKVISGEILRLMVFMPPRHGKSQVCSKKFPAYYLGKKPEHSIILTSYSADLAFDFSQIARDTLINERDVFPDVNVNRLSRAKKRWSIENHYDSGLIAAGAGGPITGRGCNIGIIDDPFKNWEEAQSDTIRESIWNWYRTTFRTRLAPGGAIILIMTRWHEEDLAGRLLNEMATGAGEQWDVLSLPAIAEENDFLGREVGEALSPRFPIEELHNTKRALGPYLFNALYQQRPRPEDGDYFHASWLNDIDLPTMLAHWSNRERRIQYYSAMDFAIGEKDRNDWNVITTGTLSPENELIIADVNRFRGDSFEIANQIIQTQKKWNPLLFGFEDGVIKKAIWPYVSLIQKKDNVFVNPIFLNPIKDKIARARTIQGRMRQGNVYFPHMAPWYEGFEDELLAFPNGTWDDQVDSLAWLGIMLAEISLKYGDFGGGSLGDLSKVIS